MDYAIIRLGNKQHKVRDGETLVVDRLPADEGKSFEPDVLLGSTKVTATVIAHERGPKIRIGKYKKRTGYKRHNGHRSATSRVQIALGAARKTAAAAPAPKKEAAPAATPAPKAEAAPKADVKTVLPRGYADMTVAEVKEAAASWKRPQLLGALEYEQENAARKGAIAALESALGED
jgi:large subunit ribosomal protein L21